MIKKIVITSLFFISLAGNVYADCVYDGQTYPEGTRIGPYVCSGGEWVKG